MPGTTDEFGQGRRQAVRRWLPHTIFTLIWLVLLELFVRAFIASPSHTVPDPAIAWRYQPDSSFMLATNDAGYVRLTVNELGLNDAPLQPKGDRKRVLALGDSFTEAAQLPRERNFTSLIEQQDPRLDVINAGRSGIDPRGLLTVFEMLAPIVDPDQVILLLTDNDLADLHNSNYDNVLCADGHDICGMTLRAGAKEQMKDKLRPLTTHSGLVTYLLGHYEDVVKGKVKNFTTRFARAEPQAEMPADTPIDTDGKDVETFSAVLKLIARRKPLLVVFLPNLVYEAGRSAHVTESSARREHLLGESIRRIPGASFLSGGFALKEAYRSSGQPPVGFAFGVIGKGHLNAMGHAALAQAITFRLAASSSPVPR